MRKIGESIIINGEVEVKVVEVKGRSVKIGFEFPSSYTVLRKEIHDRVIEENLAAAQEVMDIGDIGDAIKQLNGNKDTNSSPQKEDESGQSSSQEGE